MGFTPSRNPLIGRDREQAELARALAMAREGHGGLLLLAGEAGIGKTRLAEEALAASGILALIGAASPEGMPPYGPIIAVLRASLRAAPEGWNVGSALSPYLATLLPELGTASQAGDRATLFEAIRAAFVTLAHRQPTVIFLDDLHWADEATLELLPALASALAEEPLWLVGAYRSDEMPRGHPLRRMRTELRRAGRLRELLIEPLNQEETRASASQALGQLAGPALTAALYDRTQGVPFFIEELAAALVARGSLQQGDVGVELGEDAEVPIPDTIRDAVLLQMERLSEHARHTLEVAAVAGLRFDLDLVTEVAQEIAGIEEALKGGFIREAQPGIGAFRHALVGQLAIGLQRERKGESITKNRA